MLIGIGNKGCGFVMKKKSRCKYYKKHIFDIVVDISQLDCWRNHLHENDYNYKYIIAHNSELDIPKYLQNILIGHNLKFYVSKVLDCPESFDEGCVIFKFESAEFPGIVRYSGNYFDDNQNAL